MQEISVGIFSGSNVVAVVSVVVVVVVDVGVDAVVAGTFGKCVKSKKYARWMWFGSSFSTLTSSHFSRFKNSVVGRSKV